MSEKRHGAFFYFYMRKSVQSLYDTSPVTMDLPAKSDGGSVDATLRRGHSVQSSTATAPAKKKKSLRSRLSEMAIGALKGI